MFLSKRYGTLEARVETKQKSKKRVFLLVAGLVMCGVLATVTLGEGFSKVYSSVNSNLGRAKYLPVGEYVSSEFKHLFDNRAFGESSMAFVTATVVNNGDDGQGTLKVSAIGKTSHKWKTNVADFKTSLAESLAEHGTASYGMFNLNVFSSESQSSEKVDYTTFPIFASYARTKEDHDVDDHTFLGAAVLSAKPYTNTFIVMNEGSTYESVCKDVLAQFAPEFATLDCSKAKQISEDECIFDALYIPIGPGGPHKLCSEDGPCGGVTSFKNDHGISQKCCDAMESYCKPETDSFASSSPSIDPKPGCAPFNLEVTLDFQCKEKYREKAPVLVRSFELGTDCSMKFNENERVYRLEEKCG